MDRGDLRAEIESRMKAHVSRKFPRGGPRSDPVDDAISSLAEYGGYVAGLVERYRREMPMGSDTIVLPVELEGVFEREYRNDSTLDEFRRTWSELRGLAELLSQATGVPIERVSH